MKSQELVSELIDGKLSFGRWNRLTAGVQIFRDAEIILVRHLRFGRDAEEVELAQDFFCTADRSGEPSAGTWDEVFSACDQSVSP